MSGWRVRAGAATRTGPLHARNEDAWCIAGGGEGPRLLAVSDGVSTAGLGARASELAVTRLRQLGDDGGGALEQALSEIDWELRGEGAGAACTVAAVLLDGGTARVAAVGDSGVLLLRDGAVRRVAGGPAGGRLGAYVGMGPEVGEAAEYAEVALRPGDVLLLATDGLLDALGDEELRACWARTGEPEAYARALVEEAARVGTRDDATAVAALVERAPPARLAPTDAPEPPEHLVDAG